MDKVFSKKNKNTLIIILCALSMFMQFFLIPKLPEKYFYDSNGIISIVNGNYNLAHFDESYVFAGKFFKSINIFHFNTFSQWAITITVLLLIMTIIYLFKFKYITLGDMIFIYMVIGLANIYLFRISKDFIQCFFWILMYIIIKKSKDDNKKLYIGLVVLYLFEGIFFRSYYFAIGIFTFFILLLISRGKKKDFLKIMISIIVIFFVGLLVLQKVLPGAYNYLINLRTALNQSRISSADATTMINDIFKNNGNVAVYMLNYVLNFARMLFPIELATKGVIYFLFIGYQLYFTYSLIKSTGFVLKNKVKDYYIYIAIIIGYLAIANLFEPDYGSFVRHEVTLYFIFLDLFITIKKDRLLKNES